MNLFLKIVYWCLGLGATSPLLALVFSGRVISLMTIALGCVFIDLIFSKNRNSNSIFRSSTLFKFFLCWMLISILASLFGFIYFLSIRPDYSYAAISYIPKIVLYFILLFLLGRQKNYFDKCSYIIKGIKYGVALNLIWSILDALMYYSIHESLTNTVFQSYIVGTNMHFGMASIVDGISIRSVGLNNDPATIGFFSVVASMYSFLKKNKWILMISFLSVFSCVSFVGMVGIAIVVIYYFVTKKNPKKLLPLFLFVVVLVIGGMWFNSSNDTFVKGLKNAWNLRLESKKEGDHSMNTRILFIEHFPNAVVNMPTSLIIGTGYDTAVYAYIDEGLDYGINGPTAMENTYLDNFFNFGFIGFVFFVIFYIKMYKNSLKWVKYNQNEYVIVIFSFSIATLICFLFYHYTLYSVIMLISICSICYNERQFVVSKN